MQVIDLTHTVCENMPVYPGTQAPLLRPTSTLADDGFRETLLQMYSHTGTHMDAPAHLFEDLPTLEQFPPDQFCGRALTIDCTALPAGAKITFDRIRPVAALAEEADFLLFHTGWDRYWNRPEYFGEYPVIDHEVARFMLETGKKGAGVDTIGIDPISDGGLPIHRLLLSTGRFVIIENLTRLEQLDSELVSFCALPLKYEASDGAPVRAIAIQN